MYGSAGPALCRITRNASFTVKKAEKMEPVVVDTSAAEEDTHGFTVSPQPQSPVEPKSPSSVYAISRPQTPTIDHSMSSPYASSRPQTPTAPVSPLTPAEAEHRSIRDSMASIALSESSLDYDHLSAEQVEDVLATPRVRASRHIRKPSSLEILQNAWPPRPELERQSTLFDMMKDEPLETPISGPEEVEAMGYESAETMSIRSSSTVSLIVPARGSSLATPRSASGSSSDENMEVDWQQLDKTEEQEKEDRDLPEGAEDDSTAFLLARLERENDKITAATQAVVNKKVERLRSESRPPSMGHLKRLVLDRNAPSFRYSMAADTQVPEVLEPPPMTELEFWAALVQDYPSTATRLPTLTTTKIRSGIPPPLRGVVWTSMAGARDRSLEDAFERLLGEKSSYEGIINKDVGRSFPGVELFRDAEGEGQKMLGRVLKCFSLHDKDIGYCQGLGFLVGPLLMNMGEREAFCVLVRLMDHYTLRPSFLPSLSGLHMRIFQFSSLLKQHQPELSEHFAAMGVEPAYLSQWFLSCFAVTCPLPMLFRIYDVIFAEGANETVMRVALALMRRNEAKMLASTEFEEVMQLLLGRAIWDCYGCNADELVDDFTSLGGIITHGRLAELEKEFENQSSESVGQSAGFLPDVQAAASRFLGRLWAPSGHGHAPSKSTSTLSPQSAEKDAAPRGSFLRKSGSKHSISTLNESTGSSDTTSSGYASTAPTDPEAHDAARESQADTMSFKSKPGSMRTISISTGYGAPATPGLSKEERDMHGQIEDLLTALSEMQREQQQLAAMLQQEREERGEDHRAVRQLVSRLRKDETGQEESAVGVKEDRRKTMPPPPRVPAGDVEGGKQRPRSMLIDSKAGQEKEEFEGLVDKVNDRLKTNARFSASFETKAQLRSNLARTREQFSASEASCRDLTARLDVAETSLAAFTTEGEDLRAEVKELRVRVNEEFKARQKLEHTIRELKAEARSMERKNDRERLVRADSMGEVPTLSRRDSISPADAQRMRLGSVSGAPPGGGGGLRELRLARRDSTSSVQGLRAMKMQRQAQAPEIQVQTTSSQPPAAVRSAPAAAAAAADESAVATSPSPPTSATATAAGTTIETADPATVTAPPPALAVPRASPWHARTSSLATKEVFATPQHEVVPEEALLLELVNAKTAEAQARQDVDELKRALAISNRKHEAALTQMRAEIEAARASAAAAQVEAQHVREQAGRWEGSGGVSAGVSAPGTPSLSVPTTPQAYDADCKALGAGFGELGVTPTDVSVGAMPKKAETAPAAAGGGGGWFWNRRGASASKGGGTPPLPPTQGGE